jgi:hypothetical protein
MQRNQVASWLVLGLVTALAACGGEGPVGDTTSIGDGGPVPPPSGGPPSGKAPVCSVTGHTVLGTAEARSPAVAFGGGRFAAVWTEATTGLHLVMTDDHGKLLGSGTLPSGQHPVEASVAADAGGGFLVVWREATAVRGLHLQPDGRTAGSSFTLAQTTGGDPRPVAATTATGTVVAWADAAGVTAGDVDGSALSSKIVVPCASDPALAASTDALGLVFASGNRLGFARVGAPVRSVPSALFRDAPGKANVPRASSAGSGGFFVTWEDDRGGDDKETVYLTLVGADGKPGAEVSVPGDDGSANYPDVATVGGYAAVVYYQFRDGPPSVYLSLLGPDLHRAADDLRLSDKGARFPRIASSGDGALGVVYARNDGPAQLTLVTCH